MSEPEYAGHRYAHFKREGFDGDQIHFALSDGDDPLRFHDLNGDGPVLRFTMSGYESGAVEWANA